MFENRKKDRRVLCLFFRVSKGEHKAATKAAKTEGLSLSDWLRSLVADAVSRGVE